jgi:hypothetical protein
MVIARDGNCANAAVDINNRMETSARTFMSSSDSGRRDWTRTNDPYHVKVVL